MKVIFLGTPEFAIPSLTKLVASQKHKLIAIVCQPDKPQDRGKCIVNSPVKQFAVEHKIPCFQFEKISRDGIDELKKLKPDIMVTAAYGQILSQQVIDIPKYGIINVHASLLPKYRGASPIQTAVIEGDSTTGVTIMKTEAGLDTGDIIMAKETNIGEDETAGELSDRLAEIGSTILLGALSLIEEGNATYTKQSHVDSTVTTRISKEQGKIFWTKRAYNIKCQILGQNPSPIAFSFINNERIKFYKAKVADIDSTNKEPGTIIEPSSPKNGVFVQCGQGVLELLEIQFPGKNILSAKDYMNGRKFCVGDKFLIDDPTTGSPIILNKGK